MLYIALSNDLKAFDITNALMPMK